MNDEARLNGLSILLAFRKDKRYRSGVFQAAVWFGVIDQHQWEWLNAQIEAGVREPRLKETAEQATNE
jgi:hypothetical protein